MKRYSQFMAEEKKPTALEQSLGMKPGENIVAYLRRFRKLDRSTVSHEAKHFYYGLCDYYDGEGASSSHTKKALKTLLELKKTHPELRPDYTHIFRGNTQFTAKKNRLNGLSWMLFDSNFMVAQTTYSVPTAMSSWTVREETAWAYSTDTISPLSTMDIIVKTLSKHMITYKGIPYIMQMAVNSQTLFSAQTTKEMSAFFGYKNEDEAIQVGRGPFKVDIFVYKQHYEDAKNAGRIK